MNQACAHCSPNAFIYPINDTHTGRELNFDIKYNHQLFQISNDIDFKICLSGEMRIHKTRIH